MPEIKERPILFSAPMVRAILEGRKTVTRRALNAQSLKNIGYGVQLGECHELPSEGPLHPNSIGYYTDFCPFGQPGDRLWVRESHAQVFEVDIPDGRPVGPIGTAGSPGRPDWKCRYVYRADGEMPNVQWHHVGDSQPVRWTPSIHMRREASRILLEITDVRVERLQDISEEQCIAEGIERHSAGFFGNGCSTAASAFKELWNSTGGDWATNPWVWAVSFRRVTP